MSRPSLVWIDWRLAGKALLGETAWRGLFLLVLGGYFCGMLLSGGVARFLSGQWVLTAVLRHSVTEEEGRGIAGRAAALAPVASAVYRSPEAAWKEFLAAYPGVESTRTAGGNPLSGYIEIRLRPDGFDEAGIASVEAALNPLPQVDKVLSGGIRLHRLLRAARWANAALWAGFGLLALFGFGLASAQERSRAVALSADFDFLAERGVAPRRLALARAAAAAIAAAVLASAALLASGLGWRLLEARDARLRAVLGAAEELLVPGRWASLSLFPLAAALLAAAASLIGWRRACGSRR